MRKLSFFLAFALVLTFACGVLGQDPTNDGVVSIDNTTNEWSDAQLRAGYTHVVSIRFDFTNTSSPNFWTGSNGWEVYSPDGADWVYLQGNPGPLADIAAARGAFSAFKKHFHAVDRVAGPWVETGSGGFDPAPGTSGPASGSGYYYASLSVPIPPATPAGFADGDNGIAILLEFQTRVEDEGLQMCVDSNNQITAWEWAAGSGYTDYPQWDNGLGAEGPRCWDIFVPPNTPPFWCGDPDEVLTANESVNHCGELVFDLCGYDVDDPPDPVTFEFAAGFETGYGTLTPEGHYVWNASVDPMPQSGNVTVEFRAWDTRDYSDNNFVLTIDFENEAPVFDICPTASITVSAGAPKEQTVAFSDPDVCDAPFIAFGTPVGGDAGDVWEIVGNEIIFTPELAPTTVAHSVMMPLIVSDGLLTDTCELNYDVIVGSPYQVEIQKVEGQLQGHFADVAISLFNVDPNQGIGGFDLLVAYDASALSFQLAYEGDIYASHGWEYFTYRFGPYGNCGSACPSGMLRLIGMAEINDGITSATNLTSVDPVVKPTLAFMRFLVSNDRNLECQYVPIRFFWYDCTDNIISNFDGSHAYLAAKVFEFTLLGEPFTGGEIIGTPVFPTYMGTEDGCEYVDEDRNKIALKNVDFQNGGIDIICAEDIDARGDINLNGLEYEIADAVMFTNFFISGLDAFCDPTGLTGTDLTDCLMKQEGSIAASDANADGIPLSVADLVYLIRVVVGDAQPYPKTAPVAANVTYSNGTFGVDVEMGAAHIVMAGNVVPELLDNNVEMRYASNGDITNILVFSKEANTSFSGNFLRVKGEVVSTEFATFLGASVVAKVMPSDFQVHQNYPNPFNPTTTIKIDVPTQGVDWKLNIYNVTGQLVESFSGVSTGFDEVVWDASDLSSGIYFYKVTAGDQSMTKKAVLLK